MDCIWSLVDGTLGLEDSTLGLVSSTLSLMIGYRPEVS